MITKPDKAFRPAIVSLALILLTFATSQLLVSCTKPLENSAPPEQGLSTQDISRYTKAARRGDTRAMYRLSVNYTIGPQPNENLAHRYFRECLALLGSQCLSEEAGSLRVSAISDDKTDQDRRQLIRRAMESSYQSFIHADPRDAEEIAGLQAQAKDLSDIDQRLKTGQDVTHIDVMKRR